MAHSVSVPFPGNGRLLQKMYMEEEGGREEVEVEHEIWGNILIRALFLPINCVLQPTKQFFNINNNSNT